MAQPYSLEANKRTMTGKRVRKLRAQGVTPGVIYGTVVEDPIPITVEERSLLRMYQSIGNSSLLDLNLDGDTYTVYIRNLQMDPIKRQAVHAEFFAPNLRVAMTASVPLHLVGEPKDDRLVVMHVRDTVELRGLPTDLPGAIDVDVSSLETADDSILVGDLALPENVELITSPDEMIVRLTEPQVAAEEEPEVEGVEGEEAAEAAEAPADEEPDESGD